LLQKEKYYFVYILASNKNGTLYIGVTNNLERRVIEHRLKIKEGFTSKYNVIKLVYFEIYNFIDKAIKREKKLKKWNRDWKIKLIEKENKEWRDLLPEIIGEDKIKLLEKEIIEFGILYEELDKNKLS
jgi:putative endonuclease